MSCSSFALNFWILLRRIKSSMDELLFLVPCVLSAGQTPAGIQFKNTGFRVKPGMTTKTKRLLTYYTNSFLLGNKMLGLLEAWRRIRITRSNSERNEHHLFAAAECQDTLRGLGIKHSCKVVWKKERSWYSHRLRCKPV